MCVWKGEVFGMEGVRGVGVKLGVGGGGED